MNFSEQLKRGLQSEHEIEIPIAPERNPIVTIDVSNESVRQKIKNSKPKQHNLAATSQDMRIQQDFSYSIDRQVKAYHPLQHVEEETRYLNTITGNHSARKKYREMEEESHIERLVWDIQRELAGRHILALRYGPYGQPDIDWGLVPKDMRRIVEDVAKETGWNRFEVLMVFLGAISMAMRGRYVIELDGLWTETIILYLIIIASSGKKKSLIAKIFKAIFVQFIEEKQREYSNDKTFIEEKKAALQCLKGKLRRKIISKAIAEAQDEEFGLDVQAIFSSLQGPIEELETIASDFEEHAGANPRLFAEHATYRGLLEILKGQGGSIALFGEEGNSFVDMLNMQGANLDLFLKGYTMEDFVNDNARYGNTYIKKPVLNILFIVQDYILWQIYKNQRLASVGVTPRFLPYFCSDGGGQQDAVAGAAKEAIALYEGKIRKMLERNYTQNSEREIYVCKVDREAYQAIKTYQRNIADLIAEGRHKHMESFLNKLHGSAARIAGVIHAWNHEQPEQHPITHQEMMLGIHIADAHIAHASFAFDPTGSSAFHDAQKILDWIKRHECGRFTARDIAQGISNMTNANIHPALDLLEQHNILGQIIVPDRSRICVMHPRFFYHN